MSSIWDEPGMKVGGDYIKFENVGDSVSGVVTNIGAHRWDDGSVSPQVTLQTSDGEKTVTAGQVRLKAALAEKRPNVGDTITIKFIDLEKRAGGKTLKHFDVTVIPGDPWATSAPLASSAAPTLTDAEKLALLQAQLGATKPPF
jgi:hypothetical protein